MSYRLQYYIASYYRLSHDNNSSGHFNLKTFSKLHTQYTFGKRQAQTGRVGLSIIHGYLNFQHR